MLNASMADEHSLEIREIKSRLLAGRDEARAVHRASRDPGAVCTLLTSLCDRTVEQIYRLVLAGIPDYDRPSISRRLNLVAVGGFGRGDLSPYSDVDLLFLTPCPESPTIRAFVSQMVRDLWDSGVELAHSVRTVADCLTSARDDLTICTALTEARPLMGESPLFIELQQRVCELLKGLSMPRFIGEILSARAKEHQDYQAQTVYLLEPNVKKSPGALRDYHTLRWLSTARHGFHGLDSLREAGLLSDVDANAVVQARDLLQRIRNEMHFEAGAAQDVLTRETQIHVASWLGFADEGPMLGVERFMQHYYRHTTALNDVLTRFIERLNRPGLVRRVADWLSTKRVEQHFLLNGRTIAIAPEATERTLASGELCLHLLDCARDYDVHVDHDTMERLRNVRALYMSRQDRRRFLELLRNPVGLGGLLRNLNRSGLLGRVLPPFEHARGLIQFNVHHKYTIDEHSLRAVEAAVGRLDDAGPLGQAYRAIHRKDLLHLTLLLHDLGKGLGEDHCVIGRQIAEHTASEFGLTEHERQLLVELVGQHLLMAQVAFRGDVQDPATVMQCAQAVATPEMLRMLYVLTAADTQAVSPENWSVWKESLLNELYFRTAEELTGEAPVGDEQRAQTLRQELIGSLTGPFDVDWLGGQLELMPLSYLQTRPLPSMQRDLQMLQKIDTRKVLVESEYLPDTGFVEYTVLTRDDVAEGLFSKIAGALAATGFQIVSARIVTRADDVVLDVFSGQDLTFTGEPPKSRRDEVAEQIAQVLLGQRDVEQMLARRRGSPLFERRSIPAEPPQVEIDNESSERFTIVEVFAEDRLGRLYTIARTLFDQGLSVWSAKIGTHADQIVDAFYVTARSGQKISDPEQVAAIRGALLTALRDREP